MYCTEAKSASPQDYFCNKLWARTDHFNRNVEERYASFNEANLHQRGRRVGQTISTSSASKLKAGTFKSVSEDEDPDLKIK
ncbi:hypothetical protein TNIN_248621 [Trichonephila inaurata madagascariensis]|uniref:Uncharacterized protein n=1 Tax=Trichonephila inaurata madagascariensis TaxID=2747483 RepID=A0A8X7C034_9ARAC|nr:hypothetical protein TNIN_248621 [Trichonephila inaurata madagascariensis]